MRSRSKFIIAASLIGLALVALVATWVIVSQSSKPQPVTPETAQTIPEIAGFLDENTRQVLKNNLINYTGSSLEEFVINEDSYQKNDDGIEFQAYNTVNKGLYNIRTVPSPEPDINYVYVYCAPDDQQLPGANCELRLGDD